MNYRMARRTLSWFLMMLLLLQMAAVPAFAEGGNSAANSLAASVEKYLKDLQQNPESIGLYTGIAIYDLTDQTYLYTHNEKRNYIPASNMKLFTTISALDRLGPDYQWKTEVYIDGKVNPGGVLQGNLLLKGYGDPSLAAEDLEKLAAVVKEKGIKQVNGDLLLDESYFDEERLGTGWMWDDEPYGYSAQISALAVHKNFATATVAPGQKAGDPAKLSIEPANAYLTLINQVKTVEGNKSAISVERPRGKNEIILTGTIGVTSPAYTEDVTMEDPALFVGDVWKQKLSAAGIKLKPKTELKKTTVKTGVPFAAHLSMPLRELIVELNKESDNFYAEMLLKTLGATQKGNGSFQAGTQVVADVIKRAGIESGYTQVDGSGLSRFDLITAEQMVKLLVFLEDQDYREALEASLPIAGVDGTLKNRLKGTVAENKVFAKTGSMGGVNSLSGFVTAKNGHKLAFSIIVNGIYKSKYGRELQDFVAIQMATYPEVPYPGDYTPEETKNYDLSEWLDPILDKPEAAGLTAGVIIKTLEGEVLYERDADSLLTPASNLKLLTTAAALNQLGPDYTFKTELYGDAPLSPDGNQKGNLYLKGYGDPTLHTEDELKVQDGVSIEGIASWMKGQGLTRVNGNLILDESYFDKQRLGLGWAWDDESYYYNPTLGALALNRGTVMVEYEPGKEAGSPVTWNLLPQTSYAKVINEAKTVEAGEENTFAIQRDRGTNTIRLTGNLPADDSGDYERVPVEEPALYVGTVLREALTKEGISFGPKSSITIGQVPSSAVKWNEFKSLPLSDIVTYLNKHSDNFYAEMLLKALGAAKSGEGSASAGAEAVQEELTTLGGSSNFDMIDGSGLTRYNLISARHIASMLEGMTKSDAFEAYDLSLPVAGVDGTLKNRLKDTPAQGKLHGKTGSMTGVNSLSGYITTKNGETLILSIILNGYAISSDVMTDIQDQIATILADME
ncbi:D-alanyl-D-alanine carboxypeptidase/D-alanyl-D-alanine endopeptidase [Brevibacillus choshinensis]|uniref:D-alanyl-D-alanine carboxypeptidase/D-alanyl-D-alanine-endopeptidase n=1 Tax=Brevibacillus choshinensis TaxID=54911 RepID=A0ABX7FID7_BRECH|nr:D-alanyl-D-alanine carboxypeptidase/D-alanyl-D-alanine-endopeptidase [Brevibacillus choshinensis]QRG65091.1 D-alanyl-D-alanine carboxypeptidase/D-alanyl-D-alanine-endopeptidase [Brevibacillus choshinensis]